LSADDATQLGAELEAARILDVDIDREQWARLVSEADPAAVTFAQRRHEAAWVRGVVEYGTP
jgi:hypothetical protein